MARSKDESRRELAFLEYAKNGRSLSKTSKVVGTPVQTIRRWRDQEEWDKKLAGVEDSAKAELSALANVTAPLAQLVRDEKMFLSVLRQMTVFYVSTGKIRPEKWGDVISTLRYINERERIAPLKPGKNTEDEDILEAEVLSGAIGKTDPSSAN